MLSPAAIKRFYDRFGARQDKQAFYEDRALDDMIRHAEFGTARTLVEFGCGTGRLAARVLGSAPDLHYQGCDVSSTMVALARARLAPFGARADVRLQPPGRIDLPAGSGTVDRVLSTYVLDLLPLEGIQEFFAEARRVLAPAGLLCLVGIAPGWTVTSRVLMAAWSGLWRLAPSVVGGCRPMALADLAAGAGWHLRHRGRIVSWGIASEVVIATLPEQA